MWTILLALTVYYVSIFCVTLWRLKKQKISEYITAPNAISLPTLTISLVGTTVGGGMFLGIAQEGFSNGVSAIALGIAYLIASIIFGYFTPRLRAFAKKKQVTTLFGLFDAIYPSSSKFRISTLFSWITLIVFLLMLAVQFISISIFLSYFLNLQFDMAIMLGAGAVAVISILAYSVCGGFRRDVMTDIIQMLFVAIGTIILCRNMADNGLKGKLSSLPDMFYTLNSKNFIFFVGALFFITPTFFMRFDLWQRAISAKSDNQARWAFVLSGLISVLFFAAFTIIGMFGQATKIVDGRFVGIEVIQHITSGFSYALAIVAFFAAVMSSADTFLGVAGLAIARGVFYKNNQMESPNNSNININKLRISTFLAGVGGIILAFVLQNIIDLFASAFGFLLVFLPSLVGGVVRKSPMLRECWWSISIGLIVYVPLIFLIPKEAFLIGFSVSLIVYLLAIKRGS